jgi:aldose 1-epimerase
MPAISKLCFTHVSGEAVYLLELSNDQQTVIRISNYGGIIQSFEVLDKDGEIVDIVLGFDKMTDYLDPAYFKNYPWFGAAIGPYANRIGDARMVIDGKEYQLEANDGKNQLHGGEPGFDRIVWRITEHTRQSMTMTTRTTAGVSGFPGNVEVKLQYELTNDNELRIIFSATTDAPTVVNLTHHGYFNLDGGGKIGPTQMKINASSILKQDEGLVATGELLDVTGTKYDFRKWRSIDQSWEPQNGYDQSFVIDRENEGMNVAAVCRSENSGIEMTVATTAPVVHFYSGKWIPPVVGKKQVVYQPFTGFCLETQVHPNAINIPSFPNTILRPGDEFYQRTDYRVSTLGNIK